MKFRTWRTAIFAATIFALAGCYAGPVYDDGGYYGGPEWDGTIIVGGGGYYRGDHNAFHDGGGGWRGASDRGRASLGGRAGGGAHFGGGGRGGGGRSMISKPFTFLGVALSVASLLLAAGCNCSCANNPRATRISAVATTQDTGEPGAGQPVFDTDQQAATAVIDAAKNSDRDEVHRLLGPHWTDLVSGDPVEDANAFHEFADRASQQSHVENSSDSMSILHVGSDDWTFPIPIVRDSEGKWFLDTSAGKEEILCRRIGRNELQAIQICHAYVEAQREYSTQDNDGTGANQYAQRIFSTPGHHDGLYWEAASGQPESPLGAVIEKAESQGYTPGAGKHQPYFGYHFRILRAQGASAPGGESSYISNNKMSGGFALVAFPVDYGSSGVMTFIVNQSGTVYQKDLGAGTPDLARKMSEYNPDSSWASAEP